MKIMNVEERNVKRKIVIVKSNKTGWSEKLQYSDNCKIY